MKRILFLLCGLLLPGLLVGASALENAGRAQAMLGPDTWSRVVRIENTAGRSPYPTVVFALVFEEAGILWFYTDTDGTQSLTLHPDRLVDEKADLAPLLRAIEPGFAAYQVVSSERGQSFRSVAESGPRGPFAVAERALPNACFIESLAALRNRVQRGERIARARLLNCYVDTPGGRRGHTVLTYETPRGLFLLDPGRSPEPRLMPPAWADHALALAGAAFPGVNVARARWVPTALPPPAPLLAAVEMPLDPVPGPAPRLMR